MAEHPPNHPLRPYPIKVERIQTGVRMEKRMVKVLKALAEMHDISLGDLLEGIIVHVFANQTPFSEDTLARIEQLKAVYNMDYGIEASHQFVEDTQNSEGDFE